jgi:hypothetical protein
MAEISSNSPIWLAWNKGSLDVDGDAMGEPRIREGTNDVHGSLRVCEI